MDRTTPGSGHTDIEVIWLEHRQRVLDVAYRLLGSVSEAEDAVQDAYARLLRTDLSAIDDVRGWLVTVTSRLCIDRLRRHEHSRRAYVGPWLPEPVASVSGRDDPSDQITLDDSVRMALLVVLEQLTPAERTAFVLHDVFGVPFDQVGDAVGRSPQACRQLASRARRRIESDSAATRFVVDRVEHEKVVERFAMACEHGDMDELVQVLATDVVGDFDSGGAIPGAPLTELDGAVPVARQLVRSLSGRDVEFAVTDVNGDPGVVVRANERVLAVIAVGIYAGRIDRVHGVGNPAKLGHLQP